MKKFYLCIILISSVFGLFYSFASGSNEGSGGTVTVEFWSAPNTGQFNFWTEAAKAFNASQSNIVVNVSRMPESPTSEAGITLALSSGEKLTASENISRSFGAQLAASNAIIPLNKTKSFDEIINSRNMKSTISGWEFSDGNQYVFPLYAIPMLDMWRIDLLKELGFDAPPKTYEEVFALAKSIAEAKKKNPSSKLEFVYANSNIISPNWYERWFDFFMYYNAESNGAPFIQNNKIVAKDSDVLSVFNYFSKLNSNSNGLLKSDVIDPREKGIALGGNFGSWSINTIAENYPELEYGKNWVVAPPPTSSMKDNKKLFADTKGISIYAAASKAEQNAVLEFLLFVFSDPQYDVNWLNTTALLPARDDLSTNKMFNDYFESHNPAFKAYAASVGNGVPAMETNAVEIQEVFSNSGWISLFNDSNPTPPEKAWDNIKTDINKVLSEY